MINKKQYITLSIFLSRVLFMGGSYSFLINIGKNDLIIASILGFILGYILLYLLYKKDRINNIIYILISVIMLFMNTIAIGVITTNFLLDNTPFIIILISLLFLLFYSSKQKIIIISRVSFICFFVSLFILFIGEFGLFTRIKVSNFFPLFNTDLISVIKATIYFSVISVLPNILLINYKGSLRFNEVNTGYIIGCLLDILMIINIYGLYGYDLSSIIRYPEYLILKKVNFFNYLNNIENILILEWISNIIISLMMCFRILKDMLQKYFFYIVFLIINILILIVFNSNYYIMLYINHYICYIYIVLIILALIIKPNRT